MPRPTARPGVGQHLRLTADDLLADLTWPRLLRAPALALRPRRLAFCILMAFLIARLDAVVRWVTRAGPESLGSRMFDSGWLTARLDFGAGYFLSSPAGFVRSVVVGPFESAFQTAPWHAAIGLPLIVAVLVFAVAVVSRIVALDFARGRSVSIVDGVRDTLSRVRVLSIALLGPLIVMGVLWAVLAFCGFVLFKFQVVDVLGALLTPIGWLIAAALVTIAACMVMGGPMLVPAVMCEDEDGVEAVQRVFAYVTQRPLWLVIYCALLVVQGILLVAIAGVFVEIVTSVMTGSAGAFAGERGQQTLSAVPGASWSWSLDAIPGWIVSKAKGLLSPMVGGVGLSYFASAGTMLYLAMRRVVDGQEVRDLPIAGEVAARIDATMAAFAAERQDAGSSAGEPSADDSEGDDS